MITQTTTRGISQLAEHDQWVVWRREPSKDGKLTKVPYNPKTREPKKASSTNPKTWGSYEQARAAMVGGCYDGIGFSLWPDFVELVGIDIDHCIDEQGNLSEQARQVVTLLDSYTEISPSGTGIRIFLFGDLPPGRRVHRKLGIEMYTRGRFLTVTGNHLPGSPEAINHRTDQAAQLHRQIFGEQKPRRQPQALSQVENLDDQTLLEMIRKSKQGPKFNFLWSGGVKPDYPSQSEADLALAGLLYWWSGGNEEQVKRLFAQSGLYRDKWDRADYQAGIFEELSKGGVRNPNFVNDVHNDEEREEKLKAYRKQCQADRQARKERILTEPAPVELAPLTFERAIKAPEIEKCEVAAEHHTWTAEGGKGKTFFYCNDAERCALCRDRHAIKLRFYLEEIAWLAYVDENGNAAFARPELNEAGDFVTGKPGGGIWYAKLLSWDERRAWQARYKRHKPGGFIKPEVYPVEDGDLELKFVALSLAPFEDMQPVKLTADLLERIAIGSKLARASLLFCPPRDELKRALPRYTFEIPHYLHERGIVATVLAAHSVLFTGPIKSGDIYSNFNTKAKTFDEIGLILEEVALKSIDGDRLRGEGDHAPDYVIQSIHIVEEAKPTYLAVWNAGREGDKATIKRHKRADLPKLPTLKNECVDKDIYKLWYMSLSTHEAIQDDNSPGYYSRLEELLETGAL